MRLDEAIADSASMMARRRAKDGAVYTVLAAHRSAYVIRGGRLLWLLDGSDIGADRDDWVPVCPVDRTASPGGRT